MRPNLTLDVTIDGDTLTGTAKARPLPTFKVTGIRVAADQEDGERHRKTR